LFERGKGQRKWEKKKPRALDAEGIGQVTKRIEMMDLSLPLELELKEGPILQPGLTHQWNEVWMG
jgi:hypothetical protein